MRLYTLRGWLAIFACALAACSAPPSAASSIVGPGVSVPLSELLLDGGAIEVGDKIFDDFVYNPNSGAPSAADISVQGFIDDDTGAIGLLFSGPFAVFGTPLGGPSTLDAGLLFDVTITDPNYVFDSVALQATFEPINNPQFALGSIGETVGGESLGVNTTVIGGDVVGQVLNSQATFDEDLTVLDDVLKDLFLTVGTDPNPADALLMTSFTQVFTQRLIIPEPGSIALLLLASMSCVAYRR